MVVDMNVCLDYYMYGKYLQYLQMHALNLQQFIAILEK